MDDRHSTGSGLERWVRKQRVLDPDNPKPQEESTAGFLKCKVLALCSCGATLEGEMTPNPVSDEQLEEMKHDPSMKIVQVNPHLREERGVDCTASNFGWGKIECGGCGRTHALAWILASTQDLTVGTRKPTPQGLGGLFHHSAGAGRPN